MREEFFVGGKASSFRPTTDPVSSGKFSVEPAGSADFKTRIVVHRPIDGADFSGTVVVEWLNVSGGLDAAPDWTFLHTELIRKGHVWVGVSAQRVGVEGGGGLVAIPGLPDTSLKGYDPARYGTLSHPGDSYSYDIYTQVGRLLRSKDAPLGGLTPAHLLAIGESQSAFRMVTYVNALHLREHAYDAYLVHSRGAGAAPLSQEPEEDHPVASPAYLRDDLDVPVLTFQAETDLFGLGFHADRQADTALHRTWEVAGTAHADLYTLQVGPPDRGDDPSVAGIQLVAEPIPGIVKCDAPVNAGPQHFVLKAGFAGLEQWMRGGDALPGAPLLEVAGDPPALVRDTHGIAEGGTRTPHVDVPTATLSGDAVGGGLCMLFGSTVPFDAAKLASLYPTHAEYVTKVKASTAAAVAAGYLLAPDAALIDQQAELSDIGK
ncbi:MAG: hypothetical protein FJ104_02030 [Deltaproteobacteria bacterium]|nr:hypothetical protein [Deltaproteobacteria bacterium]